jgi:Protein of unknown function (DUF3306)
MDKRVRIGKRERVVTDRANAFARWVRLKHEAKATAQQAEAVSTRAEAAAEQPGINAAMQEPFDSASLPSIDSITADTDIVAFLKSDVPTELTRAALRRAWTSDPAIRDFIGIAENQWDFNDPNGMAGFGRLDASESGVTFLAQLSSTPGEMPDLLAEGATPVQRFASNAVCSEQSKADQQGQIDARQSPSTDSIISSCAVAEAGVATKAAPVIAEYDARCGRRSHGSALPK